MDGDIGPLDRDRAAQAVERQATGEGVGSAGFAIDQDRAWVIRVSPQDEIEQRLALRGEQAAILRRALGDAGGVLRDKALQEAAGVIPREAEDCAIDKGGCGHGS